MPQDFSQKMTIAIREDLASWQLTNTIGHIAAYLGNKMSTPFDTGQYFVSQDGINLPRNSQFPIITLRATKEELQVLATKLHGSGLSWIIYVQEMIDLIDDEELAKTLSAISSTSMNILGVGIFGPNSQLKELTGKLHLWK